MPHSDPEVVSVSLHRQVCSTRPCTATSRSSSSTRSICSGTVECCLPAHSVSPSAEASPARTPSWRSRRRLTPLRARSPSSPPSAACGGGSASRPRCLSCEGASARPQSRADASRARAWLPSPPRRGRSASSGLCAPSDAACAARSRCPTTRPCRPPPWRSCGARRQPRGPSSSPPRRTPRGWTRRSCEASRCCRCGSSGRTARAR
mmetsp:Transcript_38221/g.123691  ORF Transcript_38221/g.123691 Transcript_38221/m.123691 type:complete len:206 (+) Transcript_38221:74-691(+)